ncbi:MAG: DUF6515 family protein [Gammaproteobacteria bacterium]
MSFNINFIAALISAVTIACLWSSSADAQPDRKTFDRRGAIVRTLPRQHSVISVRNRDYFYSSGSFYERRGRDYVVIGAPIGARVSSLPVGFVSFGIGNRRYYHVNATYYLWNDRTRDYVVVEAPEGSPNVMNETATVENFDVFVYPMAGQTEEQRDQDRYECHVWAKGQTGFDPSASGQDTNMSMDYKRAISACLEGREYSVK